MIAQMSAHHIHPINSPPVKVVVAGDCEELGNWDITKAVELKSQQVTSPPTLLFFAFFFFLLTLNNNPDVSS
jgi:hypothetical protein